MQDWARKILAGDPRALARAASAIENGDPAGRSLLAELRSHSLSSLIVGITGPPGAGKSTLVDALLRYLRSQGKRVGVLAVDPSSVRSGGALLGDRIRMQDHHADAGVFIRSLATRGALGGLARATADLARLLAAAGMDFVLIETIGVGQDEIEVASLADVTVVVLVPNMGDDIQAIKAGIMEIADVFAVNKADLPGAARVEQDIRAATGLAAGQANGRTPAIVQTVATEGTGIPELMEAVGDAAGWRRRREQTPAVGGEFTLDHFGIAVRSIEEALRFYSDRLGMTVTLRQEVGAEDVRVAMLAAGGPRIELLEAASKDSVIGRFIESRGEGLHHVALRVAGFHSLIRRLRDAGVRVLGEPRQGAGGHTYVFIHPASTGGVLLELIDEEQNL